MAADAGEVHLGAGFGEGEEAGAEAGGDVRPVELLGERLQRAAQVAHTHVLVHHQALHLMEHRAVGGVHLVGAVDAARADDADGRPAGEHGARLHGAGVRAKDDVFIHVEGVLRVAGGVVLGQVHQLEVVVIQLHLRAFHHVKAHAGEALDQLVHHQRDGVLAAHLGQGARLGDIDGLGLEGGGALGGADAGLGLVHAVGEPLAHLVDLRAHLRAFLRGQLAHALEQRGQLAFFAKHPHAQVFQGCGAVKRLQLLLNPPFDALQRIHNRHDRFLLLQSSVATEKPPPHARMGRRLTPRCTTQLSHGRPCRARRCALDQ